MLGAFLGTLGLLFGSFLNVVALRYEPDRWLMSWQKIGGRSRCPHCGTQLRWYELIPLLSFLAQGGLCRSCRARLSFQYPAVEFLTGLVFVLVAWRLGVFSISSSLSPTPFILWALVFVSLLLMSLIDLRLRIIPDELSIFLLLLGGGIIFLSASSFGPVDGSFIGHYALLFGFRENLWINHLFGGLVGFLFFLLLILLTRGRGMGGGDMKLAGALGFLLGWPDIAIIIPLAFIIGSIIALPLLATHRAGRKDFLPFGPFLALATLLVFLFGYRIVDFYFQLFRL